MKSGLHMDAIWVGLSHPAHPKKKYDEKLKKEKMRKEKKK